MSSTIMTDPNACRQVSHQLAQFLADTYVLYVKTQNFHWNIVDARFFFLHKMFEEQYEDLAEAIDELAERIRGLGYKSPGSMSQFLELTMLEEAGSNLNANEMILQLAEDHQAIARSLHARIDEANKFHDDGTADLFIERLRVHEKTAWMLRSHFQSA